MLSPWRTAAPVRHPDLEESLRLHGVVHSTGGRRLPCQRLAVADQRTQETSIGMTGRWICPGCRWSINDHHQEMRPDR